MRLYLFILSKSVYFSSTFYRPPVSHILSYPAAETRDLAYKTCPSAIYFVIARRVCRRLRELVFDRVVGSFSGILALVLDVFKDTMTQDQTRDNETDEFCDEKMGDMVQRLKVSWALQEVLRQSQVQGDLVCGVHYAANELAVDEGTIGLCLLVENPHADPGIQVHCRLIEAYCWECAIPVIKVNNSRKLSEMMKHHGTLQEPLDCVLVKNLVIQTESVSTVLRFARGAPAPLLKIK